MKKILKVIEERLSETDPLFALHEGNIENNIGFVKYLVFNYRKQPFENLEIDEDADFEEYITLRKSNFI